MHGIFIVESFPTSHTIMFFMVIIIITKKEIVAICELLIYAAPVYMYSTENVSLKALTHRYNEQM